MGFELVEPKRKEKKPVAVMDVVVAGKRVGEVRKYIREEGLLFHSVLEVPGAEGVVHSAGIAQGHANTWDGAIKAAFETSRSDAEQYLGALESLRVAMYETDGGE